MIIHLMIYGFAIVTFPDLHEGVIDLSFGDKLRFRGIGV